MFLIGKESIGSASSDQKTGYNQAFRAIEGGNTPRPILTSRSYFRKTAAACSTMAVEHA